MILFAMGRRSYLMMMIMKKEKLNRSIMMIPPLTGIPFLCLFIDIFLYMSFAHDTFQPLVHHTLPDCWIVIK
jgi:hypothetical protein